MSRYLCPSLFLHVSRHVASLLIKSGCSTLRTDGHTTRRGRNRYLLQNYMFFVNAKNIGDKIKNNIPSHFVPTNKQPQSAD